MKRNAAYNQARLLASARERAVASRVLPAVEPRLACPACGSRQTALSARVDATERPILICPCGSEWRIELRRKP